LEKAEVKVQNGMPRILIDGIPVRARLFYGPVPGNIFGSTPVGNEWKEVRVDITSPRTDSNGLIHLRFGQKPGRVFFDEFVLTDLTDGKTLLRESYDGESALNPAWTFWYAKKAAPFQAELAVSGQAGKNGGAMQVTLLQEEALSGFHVYRSGLPLEAGRRYAIRLWARADTERSLYPAVYLKRTEGGFDQIGGMRSLIADRELALASNAGIRLITFSLEHFSWESNFAQVDRSMRAMLNAYPKALLVPRIYMHAPDSALAANPEWRVVNEHGARLKVSSVFNEDYRAAAHGGLRKVVRHIEENFGPQVAGYHPGGPNAIECFYAGSWSSNFIHYDAAATNAFRSWLKSVYRTDEALAKAWGMSGTTLASAPVPSPAQRRISAHGNLRHPTLERHVFDYNRFTQEALADFVMESARIVRKETRGKKLSLSFYGYNFNEFLGNPNGPAETGQGAFRRLLGSPEIDIVCAPISYADRRFGQGGPAMSTAESATLAGKIWLQEDDSATHLVNEAQKRGNDPAVKSRTDTKSDTIQVLRRNLAQTSIRNMATWWMDLPGTGWYDDPDLWKVMDELKGMDEEFLKNPSPFAPEVAAIIDEASMLSLVTDRAMRRPLFGIGLASFNRLGTPYGQYLLDDVISGKVKAKLNVLLSAWVLEDAARASLKKNLEGSTKLWVWAPGYADAKNFSLAAMQDLTGFEFKKLPAGTTAKVESTEAGKALGLPDRFGPDGALEPLLTPVLKSGDEVLALYSNQSPALVIRKSPRGASIFCGTLELPTPLLRHAAKLAGVHLFTSSDANVWARGSFISIHAAEDGKLLVNTGNQRMVRDEITREALGRGPEILLTLKKGDSRILRIEP
jgi:hypothetical protein